MCVFTMQGKVSLAERPLLCAFGRLTCLLQQAPGRGWAQGAATGNAEGCRRTQVGPPPTPRQGCRGRKACLEPPMPGGLARHMGRPISFPQLRPSNSMWPWWAHIFQLYYRKAISFGVVHLTTWILSDANLGKYKLNVHHVVEENHLLVAVSFS